MFKYQAKKELLHHSDIGSYTAYGITAFCVQGTQEIEVSHISDVFLNDKKACDFAQSCTQYQLDPIHLMDVIQNALE